MLQKDKIADGQKQQQTSFVSLIVFAKFLMTLAI